MKGGTRYFVLGSVFFVVGTISAETDLRKECLQEYDEDSCLEFVDEQYGQCSSGRGETPCTSLYINARQAAQGLKRVIVNCSTNFEASVQLGNVSEDGDSRVLFLQQCVEDHDRGQKYLDQVEELTNQMTDDD